MEVDALHALGIPIVSSAVGKLPMVPWAMHKLLNLQANDSLLRRTKTQVLCDSVVTATAAQRVGVVSEASECADRAIGPERARSQKMFSLGCRYRAKQKRKRKKKILEILENPRKSYGFL